MKKIVVSGVNLYKGGSLKVMQECITTLSAYVNKNDTIIALVHSKELYPQFENVQYIPFPNSRKSYFYRLYYEYIGFYNLSKKIKPDYWISMHDATPNVIASKRFVYCHNSFPFYKTKLKDLFTQASIFLFSLFSRYIFKINIKKNDYVIVQQEWMRQEFKKIFSINNIIVALPVNNDITINKSINKVETRNEKTIFFYPVTAMVHKNLEIIGEAVDYLLKSGIDNFKVVLTITGQENKYSKRFYTKYKHLKNLVFRGFMNREDIDFHYQNCDCLVFPSKTESWGLPLTEAKEYSLPILASDLPYAHEAVGKYDKVKFFNPDDKQQLANSMKDLINNTIKYDETKEISYSEPFFNNWKELISFLIK